MVSLSHHEHHPATPIRRAALHWALAALDLLAAPALRVGVLAGTRKSVSMALPHDAPRGHAQGQRVQRVLMVGSGPAMGWGVATHELALCGALARSITRRTARGCEVDLFADADLDVAGALKYVRSRDLEHYDSVVVVLGVNDVIWGTPLATWSRRMGRLLTALLTGTRLSTQILVVGVQPLRSIEVFDTPLGAIAARRARRLNVLTHRLCSSSDRTVFSPLASPHHDESLDGHEPAAAKYAAWAESMAPSIVRGFGSAASDSAVNRWAADELPRQGSLAGLRLDELSSNPTIHHAVGHARSAFRAETALFTVLSHDEQHYVVHSGRVMPEVSRAESFCNVAIEQREPLVITDTREDERFSSSRLVVDSPFVRFYAGVPIRTPEGKRIGALCVLDDKPRDRVDEVSLDCLRELAVLVENEIWRVHSVLQR